MPVVRLTRTLKSARQTLGVLSVAGANGEVWMCKTLELPYLDNKNGISCIPNGSYKCVYTRSNRFSKLFGKDYYTYEVLNVQGRAGIRIHSANYYKQLQGCIALGSALKDINGDKELDVIHSGKTVQEFEEVMERKEFLLMVSG